MKCGVISPRLTVMHDSARSEVVHGPCVIQRSEDLGYACAAEIGAGICNFVQAQTLSKQLDGTSIIIVNRCISKNGGQHSNCRSFMMTMTTTRHCRQSRTHIHTVMTVMHIKSVLYHSLVSGRRGQSSLSLGIPE